MCSIYQLNDAGLLTCCLFIPGESRCAFKRTCADLLRASPSQGPQPHEGDPAAPGAPRRPAAPHLQLAEGPPDREGSAAGPGGGCRLDRRLPKGGGEEKLRQRGGAGALHRPPCSCGRRRALCHVSEKDIRGSEKQNKTQNQPEKNGHSISSEHARCSRVSLTAMRLG